MHIVKKSAVLVLFLLFIAVIILGLTWRKRSVYSEDQIHSWIIEAANQYQVDTNLVSAVVWKESRYIPESFGKAGELGLMQIRQLAAEEWADSMSISNFSHQMVTHPKTNTLAGTWYLKKMLDRYSHTDEPLVYALADYNAGRRNVLRWIEAMNSPMKSDLFMKSIDFPSTRQYIYDVIQKYQDLKISSKTGE